MQPQPACLPLSQPLQEGPPPQLLWPPDWLVSVCTKSLETVNSYIFSYSITLFIQIQICSEHIAEFMSGSHMGLDWSKTQKLNFQVSDW